MIIKNAKYINVISSDRQDILVTDDVNGQDVFRVVPINEDNSDYQEILKWEAEGNTIEEAD